MEDGAALCRHDAPFLFKAFETGQIGPKRLAKMSKGAPRVFTIHEYLDWTVTGLEAVNDGDLVRYDGLKCCLADVGGDFGNRTCSMTCW